jgi:hypothetical protein
MEEFVCKDKFFSLGNKITLLFAVKQKIILSVILSCRIELLTKDPKEAKAIIELNLKLII